MTSPGLLQPDQLKEILQRYLQRLREHRDALDRLNVYPVPDGDTGTNMTLTVEAVVDEVEDAATMAEFAAGLAHGSLMGAQGNSGIILSQILRGLADAFGGHSSIGVTQLVEALEGASAAAYRAVGTPVEGTILTVLREAAEAARATGSPEGVGLADFLRRVYDRAEATLRRTPELLPVLREAGVVDAGGAGFLLLLGAFLEVVTGEEVIAPEVLAAAVDATVAIEGDATPDVADLRYEVMFLLASEDPGAGDRLRDAWAAVGDSIVVVGGQGTWNCHVHTDAIGPTIEAGIAFGTPSRIKVTDLLDQAADEAVHRSGFAPLAAFADAPLGVVAVAIGDGLAAVFRDAGVQGLARGGQTANPSVRDLLAVVDGVAATEVVVLPNNENIVPVAQQLDALSTKRVHVVPSTSVPEGIAAMFAYDPHGDPATVTAAMATAAAECRSGELTRAVRDAVTPVGEIATGDWLAVVDGDVTTIVREGLAAAVEALLVELVDGDAELVTIVLGADAEDEATDRAVSWLSEHRPDAELQVLEGGQPLYPYLVGVE
ncbi:MAG: DAK2 domain-containing protein [Acidimicrobiia bacterium]|nr:DAK2 domain-containing protein [Acidimicrobiia bacterium]